MNTYDGFDGFMPPQRSRHRGEVRSEAASREPEPETAEAVQRGPAPEGERPIILPEQDLLGRRTIAKRLAQMLSASDAHMSRRIAIGITGDWGVGKTSMLNLLDHELSERRPRPIVIRFEPWLATGRNTLLPDFFAAFAAVLGKERRYKEQAARASDLLRAFVRSLTGSRNAVGAGESGLQTVSESAPLTEQRAILAEALLKIDLPLVAIIDDVDSLDAADLRALTQLVRGLGDFERLSFVLAYDEKRLTDNLASGLTAETAALRAQAHLEKLVQMQIPIPPVPRGGLVSLLEAGLVEVFGHSEEAARARMAGDIRFQELVHSMLPGAILTTPRDIKRVTGHAKALAGVLQGKVDLVDVLGFCALAAKAPSHAADISLFPECYVLDANDESVTLSGGLKRSAPGGANLDIMGLVRFLFPKGLNRSEIAALPPDRICFDENLTAVLQFGAPSAQADLPDELELPEPDPIADLIPAGSSETARQFCDAVARGEGADFLDRLSASYIPAGGEADEPVWQGLLSALKTLQSDASVKTSDMSDLVARIASLFEDRAAARPEFPATATLSLLIKGQEWNVSARILLPYWRQSRQETGNGALPADIVHSLAFQYALQARTAHTKNRFLTHLVSIAPILLLIDLDVWDAEWRSGLQYALINDTAEASAWMLDLIFAPDLEIKQSVRTRIVGNDQIVGHLAQLWARRARRKSSGAA